ncbi:MAG: TetR/AcrR family transcriptional regulator [Anaerovoracaceae bacterium]|jgi:AcrR family transcriptional regulator
MKDKTRRKILDAAVELFGERGYKGTTTLEIALKSGVNETTIFRHFKNKKNLFHNAYMEMTPDKSLIPTKGLSNGQDLKNDLRLYIRNYTLLHIEHMAVYRISMLLDEVYDKELYYDSFSRIEGMIELFEMYLHKLYEDGKIKKSNYNAITEHLFSLFLVNATSFIITAPKGSAYNKKAVNEFVERYVDFFYSLLKID